MFEGLGKYDLIMADPPWAFKHYSKKGHKKSAEGKYQTMSLDEIYAMPVSDLAAENCLLWLWATNPLIPQAIRCVEEWGFTYKSAGSWQKMSKTWTNGKEDPKEHFGTGHLIRSSNEPYILAVRGKPITANNVRGGFRAAVREHSRKPEEGFVNAERLIPNARRIELFSRQSRPGWTTWGNQSTFFDNEG